MCKWKATLLEIVYLILSVGFSHLKKRKKRREEGEDK